jgi:thioredoxin 1
MPVITVSDDDFTARVLESPDPVLVDFWAPWCPPCRVMHKVIDELAEALPGIRFARLDVDANQQTAIRYEVRSMPTFMVFRDGGPVWASVGARPRRRLEAELAEVVSAPALAGGA